MQSQEAAQVLEDVERLQRRARADLRHLDVPLIVFGLLMVTLPFSSRIVPPPSDTCHSNALHVNASDGAPSQTKPQKSLLPFDRSPA